MILLGAGNMATNLAHAFLKAGVRIDGVYSHTLTHAKVLALQVGVELFTDNLNDVNTWLHARPNETVIYCLKDSVLREVLMQIDAPQALHLHTAGSMGLEVFEGTNKPHAGVLYPFQSVTKEHILSFRDVPVFVEAKSSEDLIRTKELAEKLSSRVYEINSETRRRLHVAGVFANNFTNCMYAIAAEILRPTGLPEDVLLPLIDETAARVHQMPARQAQTGPAKRFDENVMSANLDMLEDRDLQEIYRLVSLNIHRHS